MVSKSSPRRERLAHYLNRMKNFADQYRRNKTGMVGIILLSIFTFLAIFSPFITPYNPIGDYRLASPYSAPSWANIVDPRFLNAPSNIMVEMVQYASQMESAGQPVVTLSNDEALRYSLSKELVVNYVDKVGKLYGSLKTSVNVKIDYPYAPPDLFEFYTQVIINASEGGPSYYIKLIIIDPEGVEYDVWDTSADPVLKSRMRKGIEIGFDSYSLRVKTRLGLNPLINLANHIFKKTGTYNIKMEIGIRDLSDSNDDQYTFRVKYAKFKIHGRVFGLLGTDHIGRDVFSQIVYGTRVSLMIGILASVLSVVIGMTVGLIAGYFGGPVDEILMRMTDILLVLPTLPLLIVLASILGPNVVNIVLLIGFLGWMGIARVVRSLTLSLKKRAFVESARAIGAHDAYIIFKHISPQVMPILYAQLALGIPVAILWEAALSFLGLGDPSVPTWGQILYNAQLFGAFSAFAWWVIIPPGLAITILSLAFVFIGHALDEILNPRLRARRQL